MRKFIITSFVLVLIGISCTQSFNPNEKTQVGLTVKSIDLGKLKQNSPKDTIFIIENIGDKYLFIQNVETSCGCTTPVWTKEPVAPGKIGELKVTYDAKYPGRFHKTITVFTNTEDSPIELTITGEVEYDEVAVNCNR